MPTARDRINKVMARLHTATLHLSKGRVGAKMGKAPILLLTTTGAKSGQARTSPLIYLADGDGFVVVGSNAGQDHSPSWFYNLKAQPAGEVEIAGRRIPVRADVVPANDAAALWPRLDAIYKGYAGYRTKTSREIPLVRLTPA